MSESLEDKSIADATPKETSSSKNDKTKIYLYIAMSLSAWSDRLWSFAVGIYFISLHSETLIGIAIYGVMRNIVVILCGTAVGSWIDRKPRLFALSLSLYIQNFSVAVMATIVVFALYYKSHLSVIILWSIQGVLIIIGSIATLASVATKVSISRDWVVALFGSDQQNLATTGATLRRIDLLTDVLAPVLAGFIMAFSSRWISAVFIAGWNIVSLILELVLYKKVYVMAKEVLASKKVQNRSDVLEATKKNQGGLHKFFQSIRGLKTYRTLSTFLPGLSLALLYMTVLSFDSVTRGYIIDQGLPESVLGIANGIGATFGIIGTLMYPVLVKHAGLVRTGLVGFWSEFTMLLLCLSSIFATGARFSLGKLFNIQFCESYTPLNSTRTNLSTMNISNEHTNSFFNSILCSTINTSVVLLVCGIALNRVGLWIADLTVNQLQQERVPAAIRGNVGGTQNALNQFFDLLRYLFIMILPHMDQFNYHIVLSVLSVFSASLIYTTWSCSSSSATKVSEIDLETNATSDKSGNIDGETENEKFRVADEEEYSNKV